MKIIQIDGFKGLISVMFIGICLFCGFVISPGYAMMYLWNRYLVVQYMFPHLDLFQGILLWAILVISYFIISKGGFAVSFKNTPELSDEELDSIIKSAKISTQMRMMNKIISKSDKFTTVKKNPYKSDEIKPSQVEQEDDNNKISNAK